MKEFNKTFVIDKLVIDIKFNKESRKFIESNSQLLSIENTYEHLINVVKKFNGFDVNIDIGNLQGKLKGFHRIRIGNIRIIFQYIKGEIHIVNIESIGFRGDVYKK